MARIGLAQNWEPAALSSSPTWVTCTQLLEPSPLPTTTHFSRKLNLGAELELKPRRQVLTTKSNGCLQDTHCFLCSLGPLALSALWLTIHQYRSCSDQDRCNPSSSTSRDKWLHEEDTLSAMPDTQRDHQRPCVVLRVVWVEFTPWPLVSIHHLGSFPGCQVNSWGQHNEQLWEGAISSFYTDPAQGGRGEEAVEQLRIKKKKRTSSNHLQWGSRMITGCREKESAVKWIPICHSALVPQQESSASGQLGTPPSHITPLARHFPKADGPQPHHSGLRFHHILQTVKGTG